MIALLSYVGCVQEPILWTNDMVSGNVLKRIMILQALVAAILKDLN